MPTRSLASVIPADDDTDAHSASQAAATAPTTEPVTDEHSEKPAETKPAGRQARKTPSQAPSAATPRKSRGAGKPAAAVKAPESAPPAAEQRASRARIPKTGPITRVTVDLAVTEQTQLDKLTATIGREIGRGHGRTRIYPQHLMRVAIRRLLTDDAFRREVTADLAENRDELKRPQR